MPMYSSKCDVCGKSHTYFKTVDNRADTPICCDVKTYKTLDKPMVSAMAWTGHKGFYTPGPNGVYIEDGQAYKKYLKTNNYIPESEASQEAVIQKRNREAVDDKKLEAAVTQAFLTNQ